MRTFSAFGRESRPLRPSLNTGFYSLTQLLLTFHFGSISQWQNLPEQSMVLQPTFPLFHSASFTTLNTLEEQQGLSMVIFHPTKITSKQDFKQLCKLVRKTERI
ncbi:hypothetical protein V6N13_004806 [Hibiscus sabdariffa]